MGFCILQTQKSGRNINKITLKTTRTQSSIYMYFGHSQVSQRNENTELLMLHFKLVHFIFQQCSNLNSFKLSLEEGDTVTVPILAMVYYSGF